MFDAFLWMSNGDVVLLLKNGISKSHIASNCNKNGDSVCESEKSAKGKSRKMQTLKKDFFTIFTRYAINGIH